MLRVHVGNLIDGGISLFSENCPMTFHFDFVVENCVKKTIEKSIKISMLKFVQKMEPVSVPKHVKDDVDAPLEANVHSQFRSGVGLLQWLQMQRNPILSFANILHSKSATPNCQDLLILIKLMRSVRSPFVWLTAANAAWANRPDGSSTTGHVIMAAHPNIMRGESSTVSVLGWKELP